MKYMKTKNQIIYSTVIVSFSLTFTVWLLIIKEYVLASAAALCAVVFIIDFYKSSTKIKPDGFISSLTFNVGQIYKMYPASRSHVKTPYFVEIIEVVDKYIVTSIPQHHFLKILKGSDEWDYHIPRMELIGMKETHENLLYNQKNILPG